MKVLLDTNALIDFVAPRAPFDKDIRKLCIASAFGDIQLWVSTQSYADAFYVLSRSAAGSQVKRALLSTLDIFMVCGTYAADLRSALESDWHDVEDYMISAFAKRIPADYLVTRDAEMAKKSSLDALTASELLDLLEEQYGYVYDEENL